MILGPEIGGFTMNANTLVLRTDNGDHFHLFDDCRALAQGRRNSLKFGRDLSLESWVPFSDVIDDAMFACRVCFTKAHMEIPAEADRKAIRAMRRAARAAAKAANAPSVEAQPVLTVIETIESTVEEAVAPMIVDPSVDDITAMILSIQAWMAQIGLESIQTAA
jgi:hypothetical protein